MIARVLSMLVGGFSAVFAAQMPEFAQQYQQRLGGALDELRVVVRHFDDDARKSGLDRAGGLKRLEQSSDDFVKRRAASIAATIARQERLEEQRKAMQAEDALSRVAAMVKGYDGEIAKGAMAEFRPALPVTLEAVFFALLGFLGGAGAMAALAIPLGLFGRRMPPATTLPTAP